MKRNMLAWVLACGLTAGSAGVIWAQEKDAPKPEGDRPAATEQNHRGDRGGRDRGNPDQWRQAMAERMKTMLGATDEEWKAIQPKLEKVMTLSFQSRFGGMGMMFGRGRDRRGGGATDQAAQGRPQNPVMQAAQDLQKTLDNKNATAEEISAKLKALREAKEKSKADLSAAQKDLRELLTQRQEATMVMMGILD